MSSGLLPALPIRRGLAGRLGAALIRRRLRSLTKTRFEEWVLWIRFPSPELVAASRGLAFRRIIYEPVDHYAAEPLLSAADRRRLERAQRELTARSTVITASSELARAFDEAPGGSHWLPIGADAGLTATRVTSVQDIPHPRLGVVGSLDELADEDLLYQVAAERPAWHLVLAGPRHGGWGQRLEPLPNVHWLGTVRPDEARGVIADCDVALNPCVLTEWSQTALPVKLFDYLAEGRPVVSTPMSELNVFKDLITVATGDDFIPAIERVLATDDADASIRRRAASRRFTSQDRARRAFELITNGRRPGV